MYICCVGIYSPILKSYQLKIWMYEDHSTQNEAAYIWEDTFTY